MIYTLSILSIIFVARQIVAWKNIKKFKYILTPLVTITIIYLLPETSSLYSSLIFTSLLFCLIGDILLMFDNDSIFVYGVLSFAVAHIFFIINFTIHGIANNCSFLPLALILCIVFIVLNRLTQLYDKDKILFYYAIILFVSLLMSYYNSILAFVGTILFILSDLLILLNMLKPYNNSTVYVWSLYVPALLCYVLSTLH